ncbi:Plasmodium exported protein, unknown function [Plasmodium berghei]|uniref:Uncharacterized protein n=2 Tax=Plasmodium berghei TaxID=5821 RepID=A0A509AA33_PLABA|nr:Plasmodium exported protein, unknown function [Plasmodium berghei ANKA]CXH79222.1 Plasmodium exported protein, unknown function [Plasmodium berghei]SBW38138.1 Plasmodium exported protein, unknown function [Plasmodium berghei]SCL84387.1 Plasmodium exported protein, unknown function [Plasmodium berghei]SCL85917.1 Plasmodium exported protein, unknown function [Plasmodium berghei]VUC53738.1 Plasmodium exported protein, unknown function [Plasmodium berghei ANKA]|eukprot:XP_034419603.1 Plasmodium exported protein, unknown function [Plasmodium berghei ANKA]
MVFKINDFLSLFKIFIFTLLIWITYFSNQSYILISSRSKNGQLITPFALKVTRVLSELSQSSSQSSVLNNQQVDIIQDKSDIPKENGKIKLFNSSSNSSKSPQNIKDPYNTKQKFKAVKYGISIKKLIRKLEGFLHVDYVVNELKRDRSIKELIDELQDFNGLHDLIIVLKYSDDPELTKLLFTSNNLEKVLFVLNYFNNVCKNINGEWTSDNEQNKTNSMPQKRKIPVLSFLFKIIDNFYDKIMLNASLKLYKAYKLGNWFNKVISTIAFFAKMLIPITIGVAFVTMLSYLKGIVYYITSVVIIILSLAYIQDKTVKSYNCVVDKYQFIPLKLQIELKME